MANKSSLEARIEQSNKIHGNKYDYSLIKDYKNVKEKVPIICPIHGVFRMSFDLHIHRKRGCPNCSVRPRYNKDIFIKRAKEIHGDKYDYSQVPNFGNGEMSGGKKVSVICPKHGEFKTTIYNHLQGYGCPKCGIETRATKRLKPFDQFLKEARKIHGDRYKYKENTYKGTKHDMVIICPKHGEFLQKPCKHLSGHGCPKCGMSSLEEQMMLYLDKNNIQYIYQYAPKFLKNGKGLQKIDFFLPKYNIAIECQGIQHFIKTKLKHSFDDIKLTKKRDKIKFEKCLKNNIKILYFTTEENIKFKKECDDIYNHDNICTNINEIIQRITKL